MVEKAAVVSDFPRDDREREVLHDGLSGVLDEAILRALALGPHRVNHAVAPILVAALGVWLRDGLAGGLVTPGYARTIGATVTAAIAELVEGEAKGGQPKGGA